MLILIAESKTMAAAHEVPAATYASHMPALQRDADAVMRALTTMTVPCLADAVKISPAMARRLQQMIVEFGDKSQGYAAVEAYTGVVFKALDYASLSPGARGRLNARVRLISSLYGWLRPDDIIKPYRFDFTTRLAPGGQPFAAYWRQKVTDCLIAELEASACTEVLDLLPGDAAKCIDWQRVAAVAEVYKADFAEVQPGGAVKTPNSNRLKTLRGELLRQIVTDDIADTATLATLSGDNFMAEPSMHSPGHLAFVTAR